MKKLLMLGLLIGTFCGGVALDRQLLPCTDQTLRIGATIDAIVNAVRETWDNRTP